MRRAAILYKRLDILPFAQAVELRKFAAAEGQIDIASCGRPAAPRELNASGKNDRVKKVIHQKSKTKEFLYCDFYCAERRRIVKKHSAAQQSGNAPANIFENEKKHLPVIEQMLLLMTLAVFRSISECESALREEFSGRARRSAL